MGLDKEDTVNASRQKPRMIIVTLLATFIAVMSTSMAASAHNSDAEPAAPVSAGGADLDSDEIGPDSDANACLPDGSACTIVNDRCCGGCLPIIAHAGRCI
jgi:hypothetical protein